MKERYTFDPPRRMGTIFLVTLISLLSAAGVWGIWQTTNAQVAPDLLFYLSPVLLFLSLVPILIYRLYALHRSRYILDRDGIVLEWGWRTEIIPMHKVIWISRAKNLTSPPKPPLIRGPGSIVGKRSASNDAVVEFLASSMKEPVVIATQNQYYVISPHRVDEFFEAYHRVVELGSLNPLSPQADRPTFVITQLWGQRPVLILNVLGAILTLSLFMWTITIIPNREQISLGFSPQGLPHEPLPSVRLTLLPILYTLTYFGNLVLGLFLYRGPQNRLWAYLLWGSSICVGLVFHISLFHVVN